MKICFFLSDITKIGGIERVTATLAPLLNGFNDLDVSIVSMFKGRSSPNYKMPSNIPIKFLTNEQHGLRPHSFKRAMGMLLNISVVRNYFKNSVYDYIIAQSFPIALILFLSGYPAHKIIAVEHVYAGYYGTILQYIRKYIYSNFSKIIVLTNADKLFFEKYLPSNLICVIPNPVRKINSMINSTLEKKEIISVGRLEYQKGYDNLILGFKDINKKYPDWKLNIYGDGSLRNQLQTKINNLGLNKVITLCGHTNDIDSKLNKASIYVMSSIFEGFGMVLVEAMSHGVPCVAYDCPNGPADIIANGINGYLVEDQNIQALNQALEELIKNPAERKRLGSNAPKSILKFSAEIVAQKWHDMLKSL